MLTEIDIKLSDGRTLHVYDTTAPTAGESLTVVWHHGTPNIGTPPAPLFPAAERLGIRWVSYDRPGYGGSSPSPGRDLASAAADVEAVADALGIERFAVMGHSGGGSHALAGAALLPQRVRGVVSIAALAPFDAAGLDWFAGMTDSGVTSLRAAARGRQARRRDTETAEYDPEMFTDSDHAALSGTWSWFDEVVRPALAKGPDAQIDDDLAYVAPWGFTPEQVSSPVLFLHGDHDRIVPPSHGQWLARHCPAAELRLCPGDGHISVLDSAAGALNWLRGHLD